ncbi:HAMP domain-containing sensor histidine kinase [Streptomyces sp. NPDC003691]
MKWPHRLRPRSLRGRLVLIAVLLATGAVALSQLAGITVVRAWLTGQVDERLAHFRPPAGVYREIAGGEPPRRPPPADALPSDYRVYFYDRDGRLLLRSLGADGAPGPRLPATAAGLGPAGGGASTVGPADSAGSEWRVMVHPGPDGMRAVVALPLDAVDDATAELLWFSLAVGAAVAAGVAGLGGAAVRLGLRPLTQVERTAQRIAGGSLRLRVPGAGAGTEVGRLGLALNTMLDQLRAALRRAENSERRLRRFMADAGHELRTPLTAVQGFAELLLQDESMDDARRREAHALIGHNAERMSRLVEDLFLLATLGHTPRPHRETVDLLSLCADAVATTAVRYPGRAITLEPLDPGAAAGVASGAGAGTAGDLEVVETTGDPHQLAQIVGNLLANAAVHTPEATTIRVRLGTVPAGSRHYGTDRPGRAATGPPPPPGSPLTVVEVADHGPGIAPEHTARVFDRFYRAAPAGSPPAPGSGLGLAVAAAIAGEHHGRLELDSSPGRGSTFRLLLPGAGPPRNGARAPSAGAP